MWYYAKTIEPDIVPLLASKLNSNIPLLDVGVDNPKFSRVDGLIALFSRKINTTLSELFIEPGKLLQRFDPFMFVFDVNPEKLAQSYLAKVSYFFAFII